MDKQVDNTIKSDSGVHGGGRARPWRASIIPRTFRSLFLATHANVERSRTRRYLFAHDETPSRTPRTPPGWLKLRGVTRNNLAGLDADIPLGVSAVAIRESSKAEMLASMLREEHACNRVSPSESGRILR
jgi:hypothetical protein